MKAIVGTLYWASAGHATVRSTKKHLFIISSLERCYRAFRQATLRRIALGTASACLAPAHSITLPSGDQSRQAYNSRARSNGSCALNNVRCRIIVDIDASGTTDRHRTIGTGWCFSVGFIGYISRHCTNFRFATHTPEYIRAQRISSGEYLTIGLSLSLGSNSTET